MDNKFQHWYDFAFRIIEDAVIESSAPHLIKCWNRCRINNRNNWLILNCSNTRKNCSNTVLEWHRFQVEWEAENYVILLTLFSLQCFLNIKVLRKQLNLREIDTKVRQHMMLTISVQNLKEGTTFGKSKENIWNQRRPMIWHNWHIIW